MHTGIPPWICPRARGTGYSSLTIVSSAALCERVHEGRKVRLRVAHQGECMTMALWSLLLGRRVRSSIYMRASLILRKPQCHLVEASDEGIEVDRAAVGAAGGERREARARHVALT